MSAIAGTMDEAHYMCSRPDYEPVSDKDDLREFLNAQQVKNVRNDYVSGTMVFQVRRSRGDRLGQAFMNALENEYYTRLEGTLLDVFHTDDERKVYAALDYLLFSKD